MHARAHETVHVCAWSVCACMWVDVLTVMGEVAHTYARGCRACIRVCAGACASVYLHACGACVRAWSRMRGVRACAQRQLQRRGEGV
eukprot:4682935-Pleurochrysis_carterae.AAC.2